MAGIMSIAVMEMGACAARIPYGDVNVTEPSTVAKYVTHSPWRRAR